MPDAEFEYRTTLVVGVAFRVDAPSAAARIDDGADSYMIRGERIVTRTTHYTVVGDGEG